MGTKMGSHQVELSHVMKSINGVMVGDVFKPAYVQQGTCHHPYDQHSYDRRVLWKSIQNPEAFDKAW